MKRGSRKLGHSSKNVISSLIRVCVVVLLLAVTGCPEAVTTPSSAIAVERGAYVTFPFAPVGAVFDDTTSLECDAFETLQVAGLLGSSRLTAFGKVHLGAALGRVDVTAVTGNRVDVLEEAVEVVIHSQTEPYVLDPPGDFDIFVLDGDPLDAGSARFSVVPQGFDARLELHDELGNTIEIAESGCLEFPMPSAGVRSARVDDASFGGDPSFTYVAQYEFRANSGCNLSETEGSVTGISAGDTACGTIETAGDIDVWQLDTVGAGDWRFDIDALRLGAPVDTQLRVNGLIADDTTFAGLHCSRDPELTLDDLVGPATIEVHGVAGVGDYRLTITNF